ELEEHRRRQEEARLRGLAELQEIPVLDAELIRVLTERGLGSPARIEAAGLEGLRGAGLADEQAEPILTAVSAWLAARIAEAPSEPAGDPVAAEDGATPPGEDPARGPGPVGEPPAEPRAPPGRSGPAWPVAGWSRSQT